MGNIQFNEGENNTNYYSSEEKGMTGWLIKKGIFKDKAAANKALLVVAIICFSLAIFFFRK